jgi:hypothetical protein
LRRTGSGWPAIAGNGTPVPDFDTCGLVDLAAVKLHEETAERHHFGVAGLQHKHRHTGLSTERESQLKRRSPIFRPRLMVL